MNQQTEELIKRLEEKCIHYELSACIQIKLPKFLRWLKK
jgi:hypothetical protein